MLQLPEPSQEIVEWLCTLRLCQYTPCFQQGGYHALDDCKDLTDERLLELQVLPTGHRRRILRSLEALGVKPQSGGDYDENEGLDNGRPQQKPVPYPRNIFLKDKKRGASYQHPMPKERKDYGLEGSHTLPPGAGLGEETEHIPLSRSPRPPQPAPRNPQNIQTSPFEHTFIPPSVSSSSSSSSSESLSISEIPSDWEISDHPSYESTDNVVGPADIPYAAETEDFGGFHGEMVENSIYEAQSSFMGATAPRLTRSYRLRHRPVPDIPSQTIATLQDRSVSAPQTTSPQHLTGSEGPTGADGTQKASHQRTLTLIAPYGETFLYNNPESTPDQGAKEGLQKGFKDKIKQKKQRSNAYKQKESKEKDCPPAPNVPDPYKDEYSTVDECASILPRAISDQTPDTLAVGPAASGLKDRSLIMVECDLYSEPTEPRGGGSKKALPDISPYACFYGAPKKQVLKVGWLDKLSPQGNCVFQRRWIRFDGNSLAYYNNEKVGAHANGG